MKWECGRKERSKISGAYAGLHPEHANKHVHITVHACAAKQKYKRWMYIHKNYFKKDNLLQLESHLYLSTIFYHNIVLTKVIAQIWEHDNYAATKSDGARSESSHNETDYLNHYLEVKPKVSAPKVCVMIPYCRFFNSSHRYRVLAH